jgi:hypothetical protein
MITFSSPSDWCERDGGARLYFVERIVGCGSFAGKGLGVAAGTGVGGFN